jgi:hypothetical protein
MTPAPAITWVLCSSMGSAVVEQPDAIAKQDGHQI